MRKPILIVAALVSSVVCQVHAQKLTGAGATFPYPIYAKWFSEYSAQHPGVQINYQSIGSGGGIRQVTAGTVDFGASDGPMTDEQLAQSKIKIVHIPTVLGAAASHEDRKLPKKRLCSSHPPSLGVPPSNGPWGRDNTRPTSDIGKTALGISPTSPLSILMERFKN